MKNGCPKCEEIWRKWLKTGNMYHFSIYDILCLDCQIEQADADVLRAMNRLEELKKEKEKHELSAGKTG